MRASGIFREHSGAFLWALWIIDMLVLWLTARGCFIIVFGIAPLFLRYHVAILLGMILASIFFNVFALYSPWRGASKLDEARNVALAMISVVVTLMVLAFLTKASHLYSRVWTGTWLIFSVLGVTAGRALMRYGLELMRTKGYNLRHVLIFGGGQVGKKAVSQLLEMPHSGFRIVGYYSDEDYPVQLPENVPRGSVGDGLKRLEIERLDQVWLAMYLSHEERIRDILSALRDCTADIRLIPGVFGMRLLNHSISLIGNLPVIDVSVSPMDGINRVVKEIEDRVAALLLLVLFAPLMGLIAILVKLSSPGPVIYRQVRVSWNGTPFTMLKFRTMPVDAEAGSGPKWSRHGERRATKLGAWLRRSSVDELPQLWNVLKGDMSIVGPRPERPEFVEQFRHRIPGYMQKHKVKAGITGWAQVNGWRGDTDLKQRIEHDLFYIEHWSPWVDIKIMFLTVTKGFVDKNAY